MKTPCYASAIGCLEGAGEFMLIALDRWKEKAPTRDEIELVEQIFTGAMSKADEYLQRGDTNGRMENDQVTSGAGDSKVERTT